MKTANQELSLFLKLLNTYLQVLVRGLCLILQLMIWLIQSLRKQSEMQYLKPSHTTLLKAEYLINKKQMGKTSDCLIEELEQFKPCCAVT